MVQFNNNGIFHQTRLQKQSYHFNVEENDQLFQVLLMVLRTVGAYLPMIIRKKKKNSKSAKQKSCNLTLGANLYLSGTRDSLLQQRLYQ